MFNRWFAHGQQILGFLSYDSMISCTTCFLHVWSVSDSYSSQGFLMSSLCFLHSYLIYFLWSLLEGTECIAAWCSVDNCNWLLLLFFFYLIFFLLPTLWLLLLQLVYSPLFSVPLLAPCIILSDWHSQPDKFSLRLAVVVWCYNLKVWTDF